MKIRSLDTLIKTWFRRLLILSLSVSESFLAVTDHVFSQPGALATHEDSNKTEIRANVGLTLIVSLRLSLPSCFRVEEHSAKRVQWIGNGSVKPEHLFSSFESNAVRREIAWCRRFAIFVSLLILAFKFSQIMRKDLFLWLLTARWNSALCCYTLYIFFFYTPLLMEFSS